MSLRRMLCAVLIVWPALAGAGPAAALTRDEVRAFMDRVSDAARARDVGTLAQLLAPDCSIVLDSELNGVHQTTHLTRDQYVDLLEHGRAALPELKSYNYQSQTLSLVLTPDATQATVTSAVIETVEYGDRRIVTASTEESTLARIDGAIRIVAVSAHTSGH
jgi:SnoaL-like domain